jgi:acetyl esterase/lipase
MVDFSYKAYLQLKSLYSEDEYVIFGDSAGGGLALLLQIKLRERDEIIPKIALSSPWLDLSLSNQEIEDFENKDRFLPRDTLTDIGEIIAGDMETTSAQVSPIYDHLNNLGDILIYYTDSEILTPDCTLFVSKVDKLKSTTIISYIAHKLPHDYVVITHFPQSKKALEEIHRFYQE